MHVHKTSVRSPIGSISELTHKFSRGSVYNHSAILFGLLTNRRKILNIYVTEENMLKKRHMSNFHKMSQYLLLDIDIIQSSYYQTSILLNLSII